MRIAGGFLILILVVVIIIILVTFWAISKGTSEIRCDNTPKPTGLTAQDLGDQGFLISWNRTPGATSYNLYVTETPIATNGGQSVTNSGIKFIDKIQDVSNPYVYGKNKTDPKISKIYVSVTAVFTASKVNCESHLCDSVALNYSFKTIDPPVLRCYDYFEFPSEGGYHVKTCGANPSITPTKIFVQWFPVSGATQYNVYLNSGSQVSTTLYGGKWSVPATSYHYETESLVGDGCWSIVVTSVDKNGLESIPSQVYTTCAV